LAGVAVVTDSTADIPLDLANERGLRVVPMTVTFGEDSYVSGVTLETERFYELLEASDRLPTTSQPVAAWLEEAYADARDDGADEVVSIHLSSELSGTCDLAHKVAADAPLPVTVVDSRLVAGGLALTVQAAMRTAAQGASGEEVAQTARTVAEDVAMYFVVDDLEYLRRGGRLSGAQKLVGSMLRVKPVLTITDGRVEPLQKVRTWSKAIERLGELAGEYSGDGSVDVVVTHGLDPDRAGEVWESVRERVEIRDAMETVIGPVVGTHAGPGAVGVALSRRRS
jgi:DegV family protein with EDD domain